MLALLWPLAFERTTFALKRCLPQMTRPPCCLERTSFHHGLPAYNLDQLYKDKSLYTSMERAKLLGKKPDKQEDVEKIILFWPQCTLWIR